MPGIHFHFPTEDQFLRGFNRIREEHKVAIDFPEEVEEAARAAAASSLAAEREDLRHVPFITIDPAGSRDLDQAFHAARRGDGYRIHYAIADVAPFVEPGGPLDGEARRRGVTFYAPDVRAPLHPDSIGYDAASLLPEVARPALVWTHDLDGDGALLHSHVRRAIVRSRRASSYEEVAADLESGDPDELHVLLREVGLARIEREIERGGVSLRLPSQELAAQDGSYRLRFRRPLAVENWNAQISLLTGISAAEIMLRHGVGLLRTLPKPLKRTLSWLRRSSNALNVSYPKRLAYGDWVRSLDTSIPDQAALMTQAARAFRGAGYVGFEGEVPEDASHGAISSHYAHVTAPLRRLIDRFGNEMVLALCAGGRPPGWVLDALDRIPDVMMDGSRRERAYERAMIDFAESLILSARVGEVFPAVATAVDDDRVTVQILRPAIVARLNASGVGLGDEIEVRLKEADPEKRTTDFELV